MEGIADYLDTRLGGPVAQGYGAQLRLRIPDREPTVGGGPRFQSPRLVVVVGGNEIQARFDERIRDELARSTGNMVTAEFVHSGWGSNFAADLERVERLLPQACGVVISRFIRTTFGQHLRRTVSGKPWRLCYPSGQSSLLRYILAIAEAGDLNG